MARLNAATYRSSGSRNWSNNAITVSSSGDGRATVRAAAAIRSESSTLAGGVWSDTASPVYLTEGLRNRLAAGTVQRTLAHRDSSRAATVRERSERRRPPKSPTENTEQPT